MLELVVDNTKTISRTDALAAVVHLQEKADFWGKVAANVWRQTGCISPVHKARQHAFAEAAAMLRTEFGLTEPFSDEDKA